MSQGDRPPAGDKRPVPTIEAIQTDIGFGNQYRLELIKTTLAIAAGMLAFTATFRPTLVNPTAPCLMWLGWLALGLSTLGGMVNMYGWERFYLSYRDHKADLAEGDRVRKRITAWRRFATVVQFGGFAAGVLAIGVFAALNFTHVRAPG
jgi:hypothetical protein